MKWKSSCHDTDKHKGAVYNICNWRYKTPQEIYVVFHNGSN